MIELIEFYVLGLVGILIHFVWKLYESKEGTLDKRKEALGLILSVLITLSLIYVRDDLEGVIVFTPVMSILIGYSAQSIFRKLVNIKSPQE